MRITHPPFLATVLLAAVGSRADVTGLYVEFYSESNPGDHWAAVSGFPDRHQDEDGLDPWSEITLENLTTQVYRIVGADPSIDAIGDLTISCASSTASPIILIAGSISNPIHTLSRTGTPAAAAVQDINNITFTNGRPRLQISATGHLRGSITMYDIARINMGGNFLEDMTIAADPVYDDPWPAVGEITFRNMWDGSVIDINHGSVGKIQALGYMRSSIRVGKGDLDVVQSLSPIFDPSGFQGVVTVPEGRIGTVHADAAILGLSGHPVTISAQDGIDSISASGISATISANAYGGSGSITQLLSASTVTGSISANTLVGPSPGDVSLMLDAGDLDADVTLTGSLASKISIPGDLKASRTLKIGGSLSSTGSVCVGLGGLKGQIIINANNSGGDWDGSVKIGPDGNPSQVVLSPANGAPYYTQASSGLGGGSVGLAPFHVYLADASVADNTYFFRPSATSHALTTITVPQYGPVQISEDSMPVVEYRDPYGTYWVNANILFTVSRSSANHRKLNITYNNPSDGHGGHIPVPPGHYRLHVDDDQLLSEDVTDNPSVPAYDFYFTVTLDCNHNGSPSEADFRTTTACGTGIGDCDLNGVCDDCDLYFDAWRDLNTNGILDSCESGACPCNWNADCCLNSQDFFDFLTDFFSNNADYNHDGYTNSQDFFDFLDCFFGGC